MVAREVIHAMSRMKGSRPTVAVKFDVAKAYDTHRWDFIQACLTNLGFDGSFVSKIMLCISSITFTVRVNCGLSKQFHPKHGLPQGHPLTPYLYILVQNLSLGTPTEWQGRGICFSPRLLQTETELGCYNSLMTYFFFFAPITERCETSAIS